MIKEYCCLNILTLFFLIVISHLIEYCIFISTVPLQTYHRMVLYFYTYSSLSVSNKQNINKCLFFCFDFILVIKNITAEFKKVSIIGMYCSCKIKYLKMLILFWQQIQRTVCVWLCLHVKENQYIDVVLQMEGSITSYIKYWFCITLLE